MTENVADVTHVTEHRTTPSIPRDFGWRIILSILGPVAWLSFTLLYVGFWAEGFSLFQSIVIILVSLLVLGGVMGSAWAAWGTRHAWPEKP